MKIGIDMGHSLSGIGGGAVGVLSETVENRKIGKRLIELLQSAGHTVVNCTVDSASSVGNQLAGIVQKANAQKLDYFLSIHLNAGGGHGTETYVYSSNSSAKSKAQIINDKIAASCGFRNRGLKYSTGLYVLANTSAPAMLVEVCFVDSQEDAGKLNTEKVARAMFEGITGTTYVDNEVPSDFDAIQYLLNYEDVMVAMNGVSSFNAKYHYDNYGKNEGRKYISDVQYLRDNLDVLKAANNCSTFSAQYHYVNYGKAEGRTYLPLVTDYKIRVTADTLNVRKEPNTNSPIVTTVKKNDVYTIIETRENWGKLKSGAGWICLDYTVRC